MTVKEFFLSLVSQDGAVSSKRIISLAGTIMLFACTIVNFFGITIQSDIIYALVSIILGSSVMTLIGTKLANTEKLNETLGKIEERTEK